MMRREFLTAVPAIPMLPACVLASAPTERGPILMLFDEWQRCTHRSGVKGTPEEEVDALIDKADAVVAQMLALPSMTAADVCAKIVAWTHYGDFSLDNGYMPEFWAEAKALVKPPD